MQAIERLFAIPAKPKLIKITEDVDFFALFQRIEARFPVCFLQESLGEESHISRYHGIGFDPAAVVTAKDAKTLSFTLRDGETVDLPTDNPYQLLRTLTPQHVIARQHSGGLFGYIAYDAVNFFEPSVGAKGHADFAPFQFGVYLDGLTYDKMTGELYYFYYGENRMALIQSLLQAPLAEAAAPQVRWLGDGMSREEHAAAVERVKEDIKAGRVFQCEVGFKSHYEITGNKMAIYARLREVNPSPHMFYVKFGARQIIGASPELLLRLRQGELETFPLAGTTRRGDNAEEDRQLARALLNDPKEIAEHNMLVDLHRNDIGRVARFGTVKVRNLMDIKRFSHVQHISSEIAGILAADEDMFTALAANFPAGTLSGAPKIEAMRIINQLEADGRGPYGGAVGQFAFNGDCIFAIPIRSLFVHGDAAYAQTCGGNVYDSNPADEYTEIERKLAAMRHVLASFMSAC